jgi:outer membrane receptor for ferric coprogen and ferric-rhodotorulic acid
VSNTATKLNLSLRETPQSVSVLTRQQIDDLGITTLDDAVQSITGLVMQRAHGRFGQFQRTGFPVDNILLDGLPTSLGANNTFNGDNDDLAIYDRIEVVRGATGLTSHGQRHAQRGHQPGAQAPDGHAAGVVLGQRGQLEQLPPGSRRGQRAQ